ncbi:MAG TPA: putative dsRNA-binding protein, partial [Streptosporangiaceae bacterium]|nr:putative dsRNA-binding protein [Streptosporangiaceae bacterium]
VRVGGKVYGSGEGRSKKEAEQNAAEAAWTAIRELAGRRGAAGASGFGPADELGEKRGEDPDDPRPPLPTSS